MDYLNVGGLNGPDSVPKWLEEYEVEKERKNETQKTAEAGETETTDVD